MNLPDRGEVFEIKDITPSVACGDTSLEEGGGKQNARPESSQGDGGRCRNLRFLPEFEAEPQIVYAKT